MSLKLVAHIFSRLSRNAGVALLIALVTIFVLVNIWWVWAYRFRHGLALDIDEAGYFSYSLIDYYGLHFGGLTGWLAAVDMTNVQAPLTMALASLVFAIAGPHVVFGFVVPIAAGAGCIVAVYAIGASLAPGRTGLLAALLTACCPAIVMYSRSFQFAAPSAFIAIMAILAITRSRNFQSIGWALVFGACFGLLPLARTMTLAFLPGLFAAALASVLAGRGGLIPRLLKLCLAVIFGFLIALPWFWKNGALVAQYLFSYGYGGHAASYGPKVPVFTLQAVLFKLKFYVNAEIHFPEFVIICLGFLALAVVAIQVVAEAGFRRAVHRAFTAKLLPVIIFYGATLLALFSSGNNGTGFLAPVIPPLMVQTAWALCRFRAPPAVDAAVYGLSVTAAIATFLPMIALNSLAQRSSLKVPVLGTTTVSDGFGNIQRYAFKYGYGTPKDLQRYNSETADWVQISVRTAMQLAREFGPQANVMFGFRNALYNVNTVNLQDLRAFDGAFAMQQIDPVETGVSQAGYRAWLVTAGAAACVLLTSDQAKGDFDPQVDPALMKAAAIQAGFVPMLVWPAPDGQQITLWRHQLAAPDCVGTGAEQK